MRLERDGFALSTIWASAIAFVSSTVNVKNSQNVSNFLFENFGRGRFYEWANVYPSQIMKIPSTFEATAFRVAKAY